MVQHKCANMLVESVDLIHASLDVNDVFDEDAMYIGGALFALA